MNTWIMLVLHLMLFLSAMIGHAGAADQYLADQFVGSPLLILASIIVIDVIAFVYHKIRK